MTWFVQCRAVKGPAAVDPPASQDFLRKHSKEFRKEEMAASSKHTGIPPHKINNYLHAHIH